MRALKRYVRKTRDYPAFKHIDFKWSEGTGLDDEGASLDFPRLSVKVRDEIVSFGAPGELRVDDGGVIGGGTKLTPEGLHELVAERGDEVVFFDGRNALEAAIGRFSDAIVPDVETTRDFVAELDSGKYDDLKGRPVVTYCTGGIRCEVLSSLMVEPGLRRGLPARRGHRALRRALRRRRPLAGLALRLRRARLDRLQRPRRGHRRVRGVRRAHEPHGDCTDASCRSSSCVRVVRPRAVRGAFVGRVARPVGRVARDESHASRAPPGLTDHRRDHRPAQRLGLRPRRRHDERPAEHRVAHERALIGQLRPRAIQAERAVLAHERHPIEIEHAEKHLLALAGVLHDRALWVDDHALAHS